MFDNNNTVNSRTENVQVNPLNPEIIREIEYGEPSLDEILAYCKDLETFLKDGTKTAKPGFYDCQLHYEIVTQYLEAHQQEEVRKARSNGKSDFFSRTPKIPREELDKKLVLLIEEENHTESDLLAILSYISKEAGIHPIELRKIYEAKKITIERKEFRRETQRELNRLIKLEKEKLDLTEFLPNKLANHIQEFCQQLDIKQEACLLSILTTLSSCHHIDSQILLSKWGKYYQPGTLYSVFIAEPGSMKSLVRALFSVLPIRKLQDYFKKQYEQMEENFLELEHRYKCLNKEEKLTEFPQGLPKIPDRASRAYLTEATVESFAYYFSNYPDKRILVSCDEIKRLFDSMNQYKGGSGGDEGAYLEMYDGGSIVIARVRAEGNIDVAKTGLSIFGTSQSSKLKELWGDGMDGDGMFSRFLYVSQSESNPELPYEDYEFDCPIIPELEAIYWYTYHLPVCTYTLSKDAYRRYQAFYGFLGKLANKSSIPFLQHAYSKAKGHCGRLAMNLHILGQYANSCKTEFSTEVQEETIAKAIKLTQFFLGQAEFLYKDLCDNGTLSSTLRAILILSKRMGWITARDVKRNKKSLRNSNPDEIREWFLELENFGYGQTEGSGSRLKFLLLPEKVDSLGI